MPRNRKKCTRKRKNIYIDQRLEKWVHLIPEDESFSGLVNSLLRHELIRREILVKAYDWQQGNSEVDLSYAVDEDGKLNVNKIRSEISEQFLEPCGPPLIFFKNDFRVIDDDSDLDFEKNVPDYEKLMRS